MKKYSQSLEIIKKFALIHLSTVLYRLHQYKTMKTLGDEINTNPSVLSAIKNGTVKGISLGRVLYIYKQLDVEYALTECYRAGRNYYSFESEGNLQHGNDERGISRKGYCGTTHQFIGRPVIKASTEHQKH